MTLQELNREIHSIRTPAEMSANLATFKSEIKTILVAGGIEEESYYVNHTGRELFRKLYNFNMVAELNAIGDTYDGGFRPTSVTGIKS